MIRGSNRVQDHLKPVLFRLIGKAPDPWQNEDIELSGRDQQIALRPEVIPEKESIELACRNGIQPRVRLHVKTAHASKHRANQVRMCGF
jgi:hypothetical protein